MARTRRGLLSTAAAVATVLAGCNEQSAGPDEGTVTPVDVPMTDEELLAQAAAIERPTIPSAVVVTDEHLSAAIEHGASLARAVEARLAALPEQDDERRGPFRGEASERVGRTRDLLADARDRGATEAGLESAADAVMTIAPVYGYVRAAAGDVEPAELRGELEAVHDRRSALRDDFEYRVREPLGASLPTIYAAEAAISHEIAVEDLTERLADTDPDGDRFPLLAAELHMKLELHRREREDAASFLGTASDPGTGSIQPALEVAFEAAQSELDRIEAEYHLDDAERPDRSTLEGKIRDARFRAGGHSWEVRFRATDQFEDGFRVRPLLDAVEGVVAFQAVDEAVAATLDRLDGDAFPVEQVVAEKRRAVSSLETVAGASALQRHLADGSESAHHLDGSSTARVDAADRVAERGDTSVEAIALAHLNYARAASWAELAVERGRRLTSSLQG